MVATNPRHNPGRLKQVNKRHKNGAHRSKHEINKLGKKNKAKPICHKVTIQNKIDRENNKKQRVIQNARVIKDLVKNAGFGQTHVPIAVISLCDFTIDDLITAYKSDSSYKVHSDWLDSNCRDFYLVESDRLKKKIMLLKMKQDSAYYFHDTIMACQAIWILLKDKDSMNDEMVGLFQSFGSVHLPPIYHIIKFDCSESKNVSAFMDSYSELLGPLVCDRENILQIHNSINIQKLSNFVPSDIKRINQNIVTKNKEKSRKNVHVICEKMQYIENERDGTLFVEGVLRGGNLSANDCVTIPGFGNFAITQIESSTLSNKVRFYIIKNIVSTVLSSRTKYTAIPLMDVDTQHDDAEEDEAECDDIQLHQADQDFDKLFAPDQPNIMDIDSYPEDFNDSQSEDGSYYSDENSEELTDTEMVGNKSRDKFKYFPSVKECVLHGQLCDNPDHRKIFQFRNYKAILKKAITHEDNDAVKAGQYIKIVITNFPSFIYKYFWKFVGRLILYKIYPMEDQLSVVNYLIHKKDNTPDIYSNKKYLIFCGPRRFVATCVFSSPSNTKKESHKVLDCVKGETQVVVSLIGYLTFPHSDVVLFSQSDEGELTYVGGGYVLPISKRLLYNELSLTGHIKKVYKKNTVITGLFNDREEAIHFADVEIFTENGDKGHIIKPLGTHGNVKVHFTLPTLKSQKVYAKLYKPQPLLCDIETQVYIPPHEAFSML